MGQKRVPRARGCGVKGVSHRHDLERSSLFPDAAESRIVLR